MVDNCLQILQECKPITTKRLVLREFVLEDAPEIFKYASDQEVVKFLTWEAKTTIEEVEDMIKNVYQASPTFFAITLDGKCIGSIDIRLKPAHEKASCGFVLAREHWNNGYMTETLTAILELCFEKLELNRIEASHFFGNDGSGKVMTKCGMQLEGVGKQQEKVKGMFVDNIFYAITRQYWKSFTTTKTLRSQGLL